MGMSMSDQSQKSPLQIWKDLHSVTSLPESEGGPLHSGWLEYQQALNSGQAHHLASRLALPVSLSDLMTSGTLPQHFSGSSESVSLNCCLESRLRQQLESTGSILYSLTWRKKVTPAGRQYCQRAASVHRTKETDFSLVLARWPTPTTRDHKDGQECLNVPTNSLLWREVWKAGWPTPRARDNHTEGQGQHSPSLPRLVERVAPPEPIRIMASGQVLTGSDAGMEGSGPLNPAHSRWLMGFPPEWDDCAVMAMPLSHKSQRNSLKHS
nr:MAG TPA: hypothetical protein [Caudoviricetes sp.]